jgi:hypothetical protein
MTDGLVNENNGVMDSISGGAADLKPEGSKTKRRSLKPSAAGTTTTAGTTSTTEIGLGDKEWVDRCLSHTIETDLVSSATRETCLIATKCRLHPRVLLTA